MRPRGRRVRSATSALLASAIVSLVLAPPVAYGDEGAYAEGESPHLGAQTFDAAVLRPLGALATVAGFAFFLCSTPLAGPAGEIETAWDVFVVSPASYTFNRPLGDL